MECTESADIFKKDTFLKGILALNVHENANRKSSLSDVHEPRNAEFTAFLGLFYVV